MQPLGGCGQVQVILALAAGRSRSRGIYLGLGMGLGVGWQETSWWPGEFGRGKRFTLRFRESGWAKGKAGFPEGQVRVYLLSARLLQHFLVLIVQILSFRLKLC